MNAPFAAPATPATMPPHDITAEQGLIGGVMFDNKQFERLPTLEPRHFYDPVHGKIWGVIVDLIRTGKLADGVTLRKWFINDASLADIGGAQYLLTLYDTATRMTPQLRDYAELIRDYAARRDLIEAINEAYGAAMGGQFSATQCTSDLETALRRLDTGAVSRAMTMREAAHAAIDDLDKPDNGHKTGLTILDKRIGGFYPQDLVIIAGRPGMGKTALMANICRFQARPVLDPNDKQVILRPGAKILVKSYEMSSASVGARALSDASYREGESAFEYSDFRRDKERLDRARLRRLADAMPDNLLIDDCAAENLAQLDGSVRWARRRLGGLDVLYVDYLQLMIASSAKFGNRVSDITELSQGLKALAKRYCIPVIALSQLSRAVEQRENKRPTLPDLRESGSIEQDADMVLFCYREEYYLQQQKPQIENFKHKGDMSAEDQFRLAEGEWDARMKAVSWQMEIGTAKVRSGSVGSDLIKFIPKYDAAEDWPGPQP